MQAGQAVITHVRHELGGRSQCLALALNGEGFFAEVGGVTHAENWISLHLRFEQQLQGS